MADVKLTIEELERALENGQQPIRLRPDGTIEHVESQRKAESFLDGLADLRRQGTYY